MIPGNTIITSMYVRLAGEQSVLSMAQSNVLANIERISKQRTYTYLANNAQNEHGISRNFGCDRYYSWEDTTIDCRNCPGLIESDVLRDFTYGLAENPKFMRLKTDLETRFGGFIEVLPFYSILLGEENMRYNIKRQSKIEDFDIVRTGLRLKAKDDETFKQGFDVIKDLENPFKLKAVHPLERV